LVNLIDWRPRWSSPESQVMLRSLPSSTSLYIVMIVRFLWRNDAETNPVTDTNMRHISSNVTFLLDETIYVACLLTMLGGFLRQMSMNFKWYVYKETNDFTRNVFGFHVHL
jgi:cytochrome b561